MSPYLRVNPTCERPEVARAGDPGGHKKAGRAALFAHTEHAMHLA